MQKKFQIFLHTLKNDQFFFQQNITIHTLIASPYRVFTKYAVLEIFCIDLPVKNSKKR